MNKERLIKNCFNYTSSKNKLISQLLKEFDYTKDGFYDVFGGSGMVGLNAAPSYLFTLINDKCYQMTDLLRYFQNNSIKTVLKGVQTYIDYFKLSKTNKEGFLDARGTYNNGERNPALLYCLIVHSFNYGVVFNKSGGFSVPSGVNRSCFTKDLQNKLELTIQRLSKYPINITSHDFNKLFTQILERGKQYSSKLMVYCDPPYFCSDSFCSRSYGLKWDESKEKELINGLDMLNDAQVSFALSNVFENNGYKNTLLEKWSKKYNVVYFNTGYDNCHYQRKGGGKTVEVLIKNY